MKRISVCGIDPSLSNFGMVRGHIDLSGSVPQFLPDHLHLESTETAKGQKQVRKNSQDLVRSQSLYKAMNELTREVDLVIAEIPVGSQSARSMASYGVCIGLLSAIERPMIQVTPAEVKLAATGSKTASKAEMIQWASTQYPDLNWLTHKSKGELVLSNKNEHLADAVAAVHAGLLSEQFKQAMLFYR